MKNSKTLLTTIVITFAAFSLNAQVVVKYGFDDNSTVYDPTIVDSNIQGSVFSLGPSVPDSGNINTTSGIAVSGRSLYAYNASFNGTTEVAAKTNGDYLSLTLTVASGFQADLASFNFYTLRQSDVFSPNGEGAPSAWSIYSDANGDSFTTQIDSGTISLAGGSTFTLQSADLSGLANVTGTTEFRIYLWAGDGIGGTTERAWRMDELSISGTTAVVPEPATFGLLAGVMALGFILWRRRSS